MWTPPKPELPSSGGRGLHGLVSAAVDSTLESGSGQWGAGVTVTQEEETEWPVSRTVQGAVGWSEPGAPA